MQHSTTESSLAEYILAQVHNFMGSSRHHGSSGRTSMFGWDSCFWIAQMSDIYVICYITKHLIRWPHAPGGYIQLTLRTQHSFKAGTALQAQNPICLRMYVIGHRFAVEHYPQTIAMVSAIWHLGSPEQSQQRLDASC